MIRKPTVAVVCLLALLCAALLAPSAQAAPGSGSLYLLQAGGGTLNGSKLVLNEVDVRVSSFTDRPRRSAGSLAARRFVAGWSRFFGDDPPNAALEVSAAPSGRDVALVELRNPRYDPRSHTLTFSVKRLKQTGDDALAPFDRRADGNAVKSFGRSTLFIDDGEGELFPTTIEAKVPNDSTVAITFANSELQFGRYGVGSDFYTKGGGPVPGGSVKFERSSASFMGGGEGQTLFVQTPAFLVEPSSENLEGVAAVPPGASLKITIAATNKSYSLTSGHFSLPTE